MKSIYERLLSEAHKFGPVIEEPKKTSIHLVNKSAIAGVSTRKNSLILNVKSAALIKDARFRKSEQVSAGRFHWAVRLSGLEDVDSLLIGWLKESYALSA